jgi:hypothetical protein
MLAASTSALGGAHKARWLWTASRSFQKTIWHDSTLRVSFTARRMLGRETRTAHPTLSLHMTWRPVMPNDRYQTSDQPNDRYKGWASSAAIIAASLLIAGVFLHTWVGERTRAASQVSASLTPGEAAPAR